MSHFFHDTSWFPRPLPTSCWAPTPASGSKPLRRWFPWRRFQNTRCLGEDMMGFYGGFYGGFVVIFWWISGFLVDLWWIYVSFLVNFSIFFCLCAMIFSDIWQLYGFGSLKLPQLGAGGGAPGRSDDNHSNSAKEFFGSRNVRKTWEKTIPSTGLSCLSSSSPVNFGNNFLQVGAPMLRVLRSDWPAELECKTRTPFVSNLDGAVPPNWNVSQHFIAENTISTCSSMLVLLSVFLSCIQQYSTPAKIKNNHKIEDLSQFNSPKLELSYVMGVTFGSSRLMSLRWKDLRRPRCWSPWTRCMGYPTPMRMSQRNWQRNWRWVSLKMRDIPWYTMAKVFFWKIMSNQWI